MHVSLQEEVRCQGQVFFSQWFSAFFFLFLSFLETESLTACGGHQYGKMSWPFLCTVLDVSSGTLHGYRDPNSCLHSCTGGTLAIEQISSSKLFN